MRPRACPPHCLHHAVQPQTFRDAAHQRLCRAGAVAAPVATWPQESMVASRARPAAVSARRPQRHRASARQYAERRRRGTDEEQRHRPVRPNPGTLLRMSKMLTA